MNTPTQTATGEGSNAPRVELPPIAETDSHQGRMIRANRARQARRERLPWAESRMKALGKFKERLNDWQAGKSIAYMKHMNKMQKAIAVLNEFADRELGQATPKRKRQPSAFADIKRYRRQHPQATLREAAIACGRIKPNQ